MRAFRESDLKEMTLNDGSKIQVVMIGTFGLSLDDEIEYDYTCASPDDFEDGWIWSRENHGQFGKWFTVTLEGVNYCIKLPEELVEMFDDCVDLHVIEAIIDHYAMMVMEEPKNDD